MNISNKLNDFITLHLDLVNLNINKKGSRDCLNIICKKEAQFNYCNFNELKIRKSIYCSKHKLNNMINIRVKKCIICNIKLSTYNYIGKKSLYCIDCKTIDMVNIRSKRCCICNIKTPTFNY